MNIALHHFKLVDTISKEGTLTKSALALHLTQSALSHQLRELEREMDTEIFQRMGKRMQLTDNGTRFLQSAEKILAEIRALQEDISNSKNGKTGRLNICTQCYTAYHWLPEIVKNYRELSPDINLHIASEASKRPLEYLLRGELDVAIVRTQMANTKIHYEPVFEDQLMVVMSKNHPLAGKKIFEISDFHDAEVIMPAYDASYQDTPLIEHMIQQQHIRIKNLQRIHYTDAAIEMIDANLGIGVIADWLLKPYLESKNIVAIPFSSVIARRTWYAATTKQTCAIQNFIRCIKEHFGEVYTIAKAEMLKN